MDIEQVIKEFEKDCALLTELGFVAIKQIDEDAAKKCFYAALIANARESMPVIGLGMVFMLNLELEEASRLFAFVLNLEPDNEMAKAMLGVSKLFKLNDKSIDDGGALIEQVLKKSDDPTVLLLAKNAVKLRDEINEKMKDLHPLESGRKKSPQQKLEDMK